MDPVSQHCRAGPVESRVGCLVDQQLIVGRANPAAALIGTSAADSAPAPPSMARTGLTRLDAASNRTNGVSDSGKAEDGRVAVQEFLVKRAPAR